ncbi:MAG: hypothetical protein E7510_14025 [Ruminococcus sp.]|nr:hypothetical protein [Ruminococcus sp.]MBP1564126.1 hypothetical protein [Oscillospiraceae bacterium]
MFNILVWIILFVIIAFIISSIVLFIKDGITAKKESRKRKKRYTVMFIISMVFIGLTILSFILFCIIASIAVRGM